MILNKEEILLAAKSRYSGGSYRLTERCVDLAQEWLDEAHEITISGTPAKTMRKELRAYIRSKIDYGQYNPVTFVPTFVWVWLAQTIIAWITKKIVEYIINNR